MARKAKWTCLAGGFLLVLLTVVWRVNHPRVVQAPHGQSVRLLHFDYGTSHFGPPVRWNQLRSRMPGWLSDGLGLGRTWPAPTLEPQLVLWLGFGGAQSADAGRFEFAWVSEGGELLHPAWAPIDQSVVARASGIRRESQDLVAGRLALVSHLFPRREKELSLQVFERSDPTDRHPVGVLRFPNPVYAHYPDWRPEALPAAREEDGLVMRLLEFEVTGDGRQIPREARAVLELWSEGAKLPDWEIAGVSLCDPTGNRLGFSAPSGTSTAPPQGVLVAGRGGTGEVEARFPWPGWSGEPVWEAMLVLRPCSGRALGPIGGWMELSGVPVPPKEGITEIGQTVELAGYRIEVLALVGEHASYPGRPHDVEEMSTLELRVPDLPDGWRFAMLGLAGQGGDASLSGALYPSKESIGVRHADTTRAVDLTLAVYRIPKVRFRVGQ